MVIRISVCSWRTTEDDVHRSVRAFVAARAAARFGKLQIHPYLSTRKEEGHPEIAVFESDASRPFVAAGWHTDVTYMERFSPELYAEWRAITRGEVDEPGRIIADHFSAQYVFSDLRHSDFLDDAEDDSHLTEVYRDEYAVIFEVVQ